MECRTKYIDYETGEETIKPKRAYESKEVALAKSEKLNMRPDRTYMVVPYKCNKCGEFHLGRNHEKISEEYRDERTITAKDSLSKHNYKVLGTIDVSQFLSKAKMKKKRKEDKRLAKAEAKRNEQEK